MSNVEKKRKRSSTSDGDKTGLQIESISDQQNQRSKNGETHHTDQYESDAVIVRRGQSFLLDINLKQAYADEDFYLELQTGRKPSRRSGTLIKIAKKTEKDEKDNWYYVIENASDLTLTLSVNVPSNVLVSKYLLTVVSQSLENYKKTIMEFVSPKNVFILFNPWCKDDEVYMESEELKNEYVLNDAGVVYTGGRRPKPWFFGQFTDVALQCAFSLLEKTHARRRDTAREVVRHMSAMANSEDNNGLLTGNWSGDYSGGVKPWIWQGSVKIFRKYMETGKSVEYGQCWVFSGLMTSLMRALGIPARSVTNYDSAHDTDNNATFDKFYDEEGNYLEEDSDDSCWNFHVWNDVWLSRPDLPDGLGGWQAVDGTPQEESRGIYRCGPASLQAIKEGNVHYNYDTRFIFAEVNADQVYWQRTTDKNGKEDWRPIRIKKDSVGRWISTKLPNRGWREDVTHDYKYPDGSALERAAVHNAMKRSKNPVVEDQPNDVKFSTRLPFDTSCDEAVNLTIKARNTSDKELSILTVVTAQLVRYTGVNLKSLGKERLTKKVGANEDITFEFHYEPTQFSSYLDENVTIRLSYMARVIETGQIYVSQKVCDLKKPDLKVELVDRSADEPVVAGEELDVKVTIPSVCSFAKFTKSELEFDGSAVTDEVEFKLGDVTTDGSYSIVKKIKIKMALFSWWNTTYVTFYRKKGISQDVYVKNQNIVKRDTLTLEVIFNSDQLSGLNGELELKATPSSI